MPRVGDIYEQPFPDVVTSTTIESAVYNGFTHDVETDLNAPRPISAGGTGATNARDAMIALKGEFAKELVTNYSSHPWVNGSFYSNPGATDAPEPTGGWAGIYYEHSTGWGTVEARSFANGRLYVRQKIGGIWGAWKADGVFTGGGVDGIGSETGDMFFGVRGTSPNSRFFVNTEGDASGQDVFQVSKVGDVSIRAATAGQNTYLKMSRNSATSTNDILAFNEASVFRWIIRLVTADAESGGNTGSNFQIISFADGGGALGVPLSIMRSTGDVIIPSRATVGSLGVGYAGTSGTILFGNTATKSLIYDGTNFTFSGGALSVVSSVRSAVSATTGGYYFGNGTPSLTYDGTAFNFTGGDVKTVAGNIVAVTGHLRTVLTATTGEIYFGSDNTRYLKHDGTGFAFGGGIVSVGNFAVVGAASFGAAVGLNTGVGIIQAAALSNVVATGTGGHAFISFNASGVNNANFGFSGSDQKLYYGGGSFGTGIYNIWTSREHTTARQVWMQAVAAGILTPGDALDAIRGEIPDQINDYIQLLPPAERFAARMTFLDGTFDRTKAEHIKGAFGFTDAQVDQFFAEAGAL